MQGQRETPVEFGKELLKIFHLPILIESFLKEKSSIPTLKTVSANCQEDNTKEQIKDFGFVWSFSPESFPFASVSWTILTILSIQPSLVISCSMICPSLFLLSSISAELAFWQHILWLGKIHTDTHNRRTIIYQCNRIVHTILLNSLLFHKIIFKYYTNSDTNNPVMSCLAMYVHTHTL